MLIFTPMYTFTHVLQTYSQYKIQYHNLYILQNVDLEFYFDIHAHSTLTNGFMYGNIYDDEERFERQADFPKLLAKHAEDFSWVSMFDDLLPCTVGIR